MEAFVKTDAMDAMADRTNVNMYAAAPRSFKRQRPDLGLSDGSYPFKSIYEGSNEHKQVISTPIATPTFDEQKGGITTSASHKGVTWNKQSKKWNALCFIDSLKYTIGSYVNKVDAITAAVAVEAHKSVLLADLTKIVEDDPRVPKRIHYFKSFMKPILDELRVLGYQSKKAFKNTSQFRGVSWQLSTSKWRSSTYIGRCKYSIGYYDSEEDASAAFEIIFQHRDVLTAELEAIAEDDPRQKKKQTYFREFAEDLLTIAGLEVPFKSLTSRYRGVMWHEQLYRWLVQISILEHVYHIGYYVNELEASNAFEKVLPLRPALKKVLAEIPRGDSKQRRICFKSFITRHHND